MIRPGVTAPSATLPLRYLVAASAAFVLAAVAVPWLAPALAGHYYHPRVIALTHTVTLGWITLTIMGASFQLVPIVLERPLWSERLARWQFVLLVLGIPGMVGHFFIGEWSGLVWSAGVVAAGVAAYLVNVALSLRGLRTWSFTARLAALAFAGLALTTMFGIALGAARVAGVVPRDFFPTLHAHFHLALLGWILPMVLGVGARVYPMFLLAPEPGGWPAAVQVWGVAAGTALVVAGLLVAPAVVAPGALVTAAAVAGHLRWIVAMARGRRRPGLDWGLRFVLVGAAFLGASSLLGLAFALDLAAGPRLGLAYAVLALGGWVSLTIAGMLLKIVPFLVWYRVYGPRAGREPVPTLAQISWPAAEGASFALLTAGVVALAAAAVAGDPAWIRAAGLVVAAGAVAFGAALGRVLHHMLPCPARRLAERVPHATR